MLKCLCVLGTLLDIAQIQDCEQYDFGMLSMWKARSYSVVDLSSIFIHHKQTGFKSLRDLVQEGITDGTVRPLTCVTYGVENIPRALHMLATNKHRGRIVIDLQPDNLNTQRSQFKAEGCHLIVCSELELGVLLAEELVNVGVRNIYVTYDKLLTSINNQFKIRALQKTGVHLKLVKRNLKHHDQLTAMFHEAKNFGVIECLYTAIDEAMCHETIDTYSNIITTLDTLSRGLSPVLKRFVLVTSHSNMGKNIYLSRTAQHFPVTVLDSSSLTNHYWRDIVEAIKISLSHENTALLIKVNNKMKPSLMKQLYDLTDIDFSTLADTTTLQELGLRSDKIRAITSLLRDSYNIVLEDDGVCSLNIKQFKDLSNKIEDKLVPVQGLQCFFSKLDVDEYYATLDVISLPTLTNCNTDSDEIETDITYLYIIPGMEGHHERFCELCERLKIPALVLQPGLDHEGESVRETAGRYVKIIEKIMTTRKNFYLLGYESGITVALEMAAILEDRGLTGTVFCVGCSPNELKIEIEHQLSKFVSEEQLQDAVVRHIYTLMSGNKRTEELDIELRSAQTLRDKVSVCVDCARGDTTHSLEHVRRTVHAAVKRLQQVRVRGLNVAQRLLRSRLILLQGTTKQSTEISLQQHTLQPLITHQLSSPIIQISNDMRLPAIVNSYLDNETLQFYEQRNLCYSYYVNDDSCGLE